VGIQNCWFWLPDAFTPNGDGKNDVIRVVGITKLITNFEFAIFNRWGQRVFFTNDPRDGWDGVFKGELQDLGTYNYMISYRLRNKNYFDKGTIQLIR
jgi:gliding motility-associated-like protein